MNLIMVHQLSKHQKLFMIFNIYNMHQSITILFTHIFVTNVGSWFMTKNMFPISEWLASNIFFKDLLK